MWLNRVCSFELSISKNELKVLFSSSRPFIFSSRDERFSLTCVVWQVVEMAWCQIFFHSGKHGCSLTSFLYFTIIIKTVLMFWIEHNVVEVRVAKPEPALDSSHECDNISDSLAEFACCQREQLVHAKPDLSPSLTIPHIWMMKKTSLSWKLKNFWLSLSQQIVCHIDVRGNANFGLLPQYLFLTCWNLDTLCRIEQTPGRNIGRSFSGIRALTAVKISHRSG